MRYYTNPCTDAWWNMALDEWVLQNGPDEPVFWLWRNAPAVIVGYNQDVQAEVNLEYLREHDIKLARRVTGGGAVYHDLQNLNYSFAGPVGTVHPQIFADALVQLGLPAELTGRNDIFVEGRKVSGYARRLWKNRELVHGTLMYNVDIDTLTAALDVPSSKLHRKGVASVRSRVVNVKDYLPGYKMLDEVQGALQSILSSFRSPVKAGGDACSSCPATTGHLTVTPGTDRGSHGHLTLTPAQRTEVDTLASTKFSTPEWIYGRFE